MKKIYRMLFLALVCFFVSFVLLPHGAQAATLVTTASASSSLTLPAVNAPSGNTIVVFTKNEGADPTSVHDNMGNVYAKIGCKDISNVLSTCMWYAKNITGSASLVVSSTVSGSSFPRSLLWEFSGLDPVSPLDASSTQTGTTASTLTSPTFTTANTDVIVTAIGSEGGSFTKNTAGKTFGLAATLNFNAIGVDTGGESLIGVPAGSGTSSISWTGSAPAQEILFTAAFKVAQPGPTINSFTASPSSISSGGSATLSWNISNASSTTIDNGVGSVAIPTGTVTVSPTVTTTYTLTATNPQGSVTTQTTVTVTVPDTTPPTVSITSPINGALVRGIITASSTASDNVGVAGVQFLLDGLNLGNEVTAPPYLISWNTSAASDGSHVLSARALDAAGNTGTSTPVTVTVDNQPPTGSVVIDGGAPATNSTAAILTLAATDDLGTVSQMRFSNTGSSFSTAQAYATTATWTLTSGSGIKTVYAQFKDPAGNWSASATSTITLDTTAPTISAVASTNITGNSATITWTTNEPATSQVNYGLTTSYGATTTLDTNLVTSHSVLVSGLSPSTTYHYRVRSKDAAGNEKVGTDSKFTTSAVVDTQPPTVPTNLAASAVSSSQINLTWTASTDNVGVARYLVFRNGSQVGMTPATNFSDTGLSPLTTYTYTVAAQDAAGNTSAQSSSTQATTLLAPDTTPPIVSMTSPAPNSTVSGTSTGISATANDPVVTGQINSGVASVQFLLDGTPFGAAVTSTPYSLLWDTTMAMNGLHTLAATAVDGAGNATTSPSITIDVNNLDATPPSVPTNLAATSTSSSQINLSWTASTDPDNTPSQLAYGVYRNGTWVATTTPGTTSFSDTGLTASTTYTYTVSAQDLAGNTSDQSAAASATTLAASSATPGLVQTVGYLSNESDDPGNHFRVVLPNPVLSGNFVGVAVTYPSGTTPTITDNNGTNTWIDVIDCSAHTTWLDQKYSLFYSLNTAPGTQTITVNFGANQENVNIHVVEFNNIALSSAVDGVPVCTTGITGPNIDSGAITTTQDGDLIWNYVVDEYNGIFGENNPISNISFGNNFTGLYGDQTLGTGAQFAIQPTHGVIHATSTWAQSTHDNFASVAIAFKSAAAGTAPGPGIRIIREDFFSPQFQNSPFTFPCSGNLIVALTAEGSYNEDALGGITDNFGNTWNKINPGTYSPYLFHADNATCSSALHGVVNISGSVEYDQIVFYDITGAATVPLDTAATCPSPSTSGGVGTGSCINNGNTTIPNQDIVDAPDITPGTAHGLVLSALNDGIGPASSSINYTFDPVWYTSSTDQSWFNWGDGISHAYNPDTSPLNFGYHWANNGTLTTWNAMATAFKAAGQ